MAALGTNMGKAKKKDAPLASDKPAQKAKKAKPVKVKATSKKAVSKAVTKKKDPTPKLKKAVVTKSKKPVAKKSDTPTKKKITKPVSTKSIPKVKAKPASKPEAKKEDKKLSLRNANLILEPSKRKKIRKAKVILEGDLSINNVDAFMSQIEPLFDDYDFIDFYQREITALDLCHIQMLFYFQNHPGRKGKTVTVNSEMSTEIKKVITNAGFKEFMFIPKLV